METTVVNYNITINSHLKMVMGQSAIVAISVPLSITIRTRKWPF